MDFQSIVVELGFLMVSAFTKSLLIVVLLLPGWLFSVQAQTKSIDLTDITDIRADCLTRSLQQQRTQIHLQNDCPEIYHALQQNGLAITLEAPLPEQVSLTQLQMLQNAIQFAVKPELLDESGLDALLADIYIVKPEDQASNWWEQFLAWLNNFKAEKYETEFNWLVTFLEAITPSTETARIIMYSVFGLTILLAVGLVSRELYLSGVFVRRKRRQKQEKLAIVNVVSSPKQLLSFAEIKQLAAPVQTIALLKSAIAHLMNIDSLPKNAALTNFELKRCLQDQNSPTAEPFSLLLADAEPVLYGDVMPSDHALERCWQHAEQILKT